MGFWGKSKVHFAAAPRIRKRIRLRMRFLRKCKNALGDPVPSDPVPSCDSDRIRAENLRNRQNKENEYPGKRDFLELP